MLDVKERVVYKNDESVYKVTENGTDEKFKENYDNDGRWGYEYVVFIGFSVVFTIIVAPMSSIGLLYNDFLEDIGEGASGLTLVFGVSNAVISLAGLLTTCALKRYTLRQVGLIGAAIFSIGSLLAIFMGNIIHFVCFNGFFQAVGIGIMIPISLTSMNNYFNNKRAAMMGAASVVIGAGAMIYPMVLELAMEHYGFRGTLVLICALNFNVIPGMAVMRTVDCGNLCKGSLTSNCERVKKEKDFKITKTKFPNVEEIFNNNEKDMKDAVNDPLICQSMIIILPAESKGSLSSLMPERNASHCSTILKRNIHSDYETNLTRATSIVSLGNWTSNVLATQAIHTNDGKWKVLVDFLDLNLLKDPIYVNICLGITLSTFSDITFFTLEPIVLNFYGFSKPEIAYCITIGAACDLVSRALLAAVSFYIRLRCRDVLFAGNLFIIVFRIAFSQFTDLFWLLVLTGCLGFFRNWLHVNIPLAFAEHTGEERFPAAYGLFMMVSGVLTLFLSPFIGYLQGITHSFQMMFHLLTVCSLLCTVPWLLEYIYRWYKKDKPNDRIVFSSDI